MPGCVSVAIIFSLMVSNYRESILISGLVLSVKCGVKVAILGIFYTKNSVQAKNNFVILRSCDNFTDRSEFCSLLDVWP